MRVEHGGHWADISDAPFTWGQRNRIRDAADGPFFQSFATTIVAERVMAWSEPGDPHDAKAWDEVDGTFGDKVLSAVLAQWKDTPDPNTTSGDVSRSDTSPQGSESETPIQPS